MSIGSMPCSFIWPMCALFPRIPSIPPWTFGCRVFTRPSSISGKPVNSDTSVTFTFASRSAFAVPPVDSISTPIFLSFLANWTTPVLSDTLMSARCILDI